MAAFNKIILMGNLTKDPELRYTGGGSAVCSFRLAVNRAYKTQTGELRDDTCYIDITAWGKTGENCSNYLRKGAPVLVEGFLRFETWVDKATGQNRNRHSVSAEVVRFLGGPQNRETNDQSKSQYQQPAAQPQYQQPVAQPQYQQPVAQVAPQQQYQQPAAQPQYQQPAAQAVPPTTDYQQPVAQNVPQTTDYQQPVAQAAPQPQFQQPVAQSVPQSVDFQEANAPQMPPEQQPVVVQTQVTAPVAPPAEYQTQVQKAPQTPSFDPPPMPDFDSEVEDDIPF